MAGNMEGDCGGTGVFTDGASETEAGKAEVRGRLEPEVGCCC